MSLRNLLIAMVCISTAGAAAGDDGDLPLSPGTEAPGFIATTLEGIPVSLEQWEGRVVVLNYFITWYRDAGEHLRMMEALQTAYSQEGMRLVSISLDEGERAMDEAGELVRKHEIAHPVILDPEHQIAGSYGVRALPAIFVIDRSGNIAHYHEGYTEGDARRLSRAIAAALEVEEAIMDVEETEVVEVAPEEPEKPVCNCFRPQEQ